MKRNNIEQIFVQYNYPFYFLVVLTFLLSTGLPNSGPLYDRTLFQLFILSYTIWEVFGNSFRCTIDNDNLCFAFFINITKKFEIAKIVDIKMHQNSGNHDHNKIRITDDKGETIISFNGSATSFLLLKGKLELLGFNISLF
jgi:hypothetical protein